MHQKLVARLSARARLHDLTTLDAEPLAVAPDRALMEGVLFGSGRRPVIVVPRGWNIFRAPDRRRLDGGADHSVLDPAQ